MQLAREEILRDAELDPPMTRIQKSLNIMGGGILKHQEGDE
jgi:hypothetical protein